MPHNIPQHGFLRRIVEINDTSNRKTRVEIWNKLQALVKETLLFKKIHNYYITTLQIQKL